MSEGPTPAAARERPAHMPAAPDATADDVARTRAAFDADRAVRNAVLFQLVVLAQRRRRPSTPTRRCARFPAVPWSTMARVRDRIGRHDDTLDRDVVRDTATIGARAAREAIRAAVEALGRPAGSPPG